MPTSHPLRFIGRRIHLPRFHEAGVNRAIAPDLLGCTCEPLTSVVANAEPGEHPLRSIKKQQPIAGAYRTGSQSPS